MRKNLNSYAESLKHLKYRVISENYSNEIKRIIDIDHLSYFCSHFGDCKPEEINNIVLYGFSRGGAMSFIFAKCLYEDIKLRNIPIDIIGMEPVPGNSILSSKLKKKVYNNTPVRANAVEAYDLKKCTNIKHAVIALGSYNKSFLTQIVPKFSSVTKTDIFVNYNGKEHGCFPSNYCIKNLKRFMGIKIDEVVDSKFKVVKLQKFKLFVPNKKFDLHFDSEASGNFKTDVGAGSRDNHFIFANDEYLRQLFSDLVIYLQNGDSKKFRYFDRSIQELTWLKINDVETIKLLQAIVNESYKNHSFTALARAVSLSEWQKEKGFGFETTKFGYFGKLIQLLTFEYSSQIDSLYNNCIDKMRSRLKVFMDEGAALIDSVGKTNFDKLIVRLNSDLKEQNILYVENNAYIRVADDQVPSDNEVEALKASIFDSVNKYILKYKIKKDRGIFKHHGKNGYLRIELFKLNVNEKNTADSIFEELRDFISQRNGYSHFKGNINFEETSGSGHIVRGIFDYYRLFYSYDKSKKRKYPALLTVYNQLISFINDYYFPHDWDAAFSWRMSTYFKHYTSKRVDQKKLL
ncbi:MAG: hypothetical protein GY718_03595 [Lentisphaerae bacterium]|nr:hypothetical protein [Lentisphaerota bacterium]